MYLQRGQEFSVSEINVHHSDITSTCGRPALLPTVPSQYPLQTLLVGTSISAVRGMHGTSGHLFTCSLSYDEPYHKTLPIWLTRGAWFSKSALVVPVPVWNTACRKGRKASFYSSLPPSQLLSIRMQYRGTQNLSSMTSNLNQHLPLLHTNLLKHGGV